MSVPLTLGEPIIGDAPEAEAISSSAEEDEDGDVVDAPIPDLPFDWKMCADPLNAAAQVQVQLGSGPADDEDGFRGFSPGELQLEEAAHWRIKMDRLAAGCQGWPDFATVLAAADAKAAKKGKKLPAATTADAAESPKNPRLTQPKESKRQWRPTAMLLKPLTSGKSSRSSWLEAQRLECTVYSRNST